MVLANSDPVVTIHSTFTGQSITLFGNIEPGTGSVPQTGPYDVVILVRGPATDRIVRKMERQFGIMLNAEQAVYRGLPSYYAVISSRMVEPAGNAEIAALRAALAAAEQRADLAELNAAQARAESAQVRAESAQVRAEKTNGEAEIARLKLEIEKLRRSLYGQRSERKAKLLDQLEFELEDLEAAATEDELAAEMAAARTTPVKAFTRKRPQRRAFPDHLPRPKPVNAAGPITWSSWART